MQRKSDCIDASNAALRGRSGRLGPRWSSNRRVYTAMIAGIAVVAIVVYRAHVRAEAGTDLCRSVRADDLQGVIRALHAGADPNVREHVSYKQDLSLALMRTQRQRAIDVAAGLDNLPVVEALLRSGADPTDGTLKHSLALYHAHRNHDEQMVKLLLSYGAKP